MYVFLFYRTFFGMIYSGSRRYFTVSCLFLFRISQRRQATLRDRVIHIFTSASEDKSR